MIASWSMVMVHALMAADPSNSPVYVSSWGRKTNEAREHLAIGNQMYYLSRPISQHSRHGFCLEVNIGQNLAIYASIRCIKSLLTRLV